ncbi:unnamed protein product [Trichogramma brassicae]|uniref:PRANC domain-containing protein n=1 Tax=Trichogramma brassicae TaxID=86971 RepID=A0A6H5IRB6_9HYME|nr:unnamed protein product [Trichogramma brassicae]
MRYLSHIIYTKSGYKDEPDLDEYGKPILRRTTAVHWAARNNHYFEVIENLFKIYHRFDTNYVDEFGYTHFHVACEYGYEDVVEKFLELGQDPNSLSQESDGCSVDLLLDSMGKLMVMVRKLAALKECSELVWILIKSQTSLDDLTLHLAGKFLHLLSSKRDDDELARMLFKCSGCESDTSSVDSMLHRVWKLVRIFRENNDDEDIARKIFKISGGIRHTVRVRKNLRSTPLNLALKMGHKGTVELLLRRGAGPNIADKNGLTPLHTICQRDDDDDENDDLLKLFLEINDELNQLVEVDAKDKKGNTPLHLALAKRHKDLIEVLLRRGADPNCVNEERVSALHIICQTNYSDSYVEVFFRINDEIQQIVQVDVKNKFGHTPLQLAVASLLPDTVDVLLDRGADLSSFVFLTAEDFDESIGSIKDIDEHERFGFKIKLTSDAVSIVEILKQKGYELGRSDALLIMKWFTAYELFAKSTDLDNCWYDDEEFVSKSKDIVIKPDLSLCELVQLRTEKAAKLLKHEDWDELARSKKLSDLPIGPSATCAVYLCEMMSRRFFRQWALDSLLELIRYELPILCCEKIIEQLMNEDLHRICLAAAQRSQ